MPDESEPKALPVGLELSNPAFSAALIRRWQAHIDVQAQELRHLLNGFMAWHGEAQARLQRLHDLVAELERQLGGSDDATPP